MSVRSRHSGATSAAPHSASVSATTIALLATLGGLSIVAGPTFYDLARQVWSTDEQGHGPLIVGVSAWLLWSKRKAFLELPDAPALLAGWLVMALALLMYVLGRSQAFLQVEVAALIGVVTSCALLFKGSAGLRLTWFPLFFLIFMIPLPGVLVQAVTIPLKTAVSYVAENLLHQLDFPVARTGVILMVGQYQLLVADACAGINSMFTLEAFGLLYAHVMGYTSRLRNILLLVLVVPCAFVANVVRVIILIMVTYYFGDEAGQGFVHGFAGMILFIVAMITLLGIDSLLGRMLNAAPPSAR